MDLEVPENNLPPSPAQVAGKKVRLIREKISQKEIDAIIESYNASRRSAAETVRHLVNTGRLLNEAQAKLRQSKSLDQRWENWVARNLPFKIRAAQRYMKAARDVEDNPLLLELPPEDFIAAIWGNEPKQLPNGKGDKKGKGVVNDASDEADDDDGDTSQHGGPGFAPSFLPDKGKPGFDLFKHVVGALDREFFDSEAITSKEKLTFIEELSVWLEARREVFLNRAAAQEKAKGEQK